MLDAYASTLSADELLLEYTRVSATATSGRSTVFSLRKEPLFLSPLLS